MSAIIAPIIVGISQILKIAFNINPKFIPLINLILGILLSVVFIGFSRDNILNGVILGLSASGLYSGAKNTLQGIGIIGDNNDDGNN